MKLLQMQYKRRDMTYLENALRKKKEFLNFLKQQKNFIVLSSCVKCKCPLIVITRNGTHHMEFVTYDCDGDMFCPECSNTIFYNDKIAIIILGNDNVRISYANKEKCIFFCNVSFLKNDFRETIKSFSLNKYNEFLSISNNFHKINAFYTGS